MAWHIFPPWSTNEEHSLFSWEESHLCAPSLLESTTRRNATPHPKQHSPFATKEDIATPNKREAGANTFYPFFSFCLPTTNENNVWFSLVTEMKLPCRTSNRTGEGMGVLWGAKYNVLLCLAGHHLSLRLLLNARSVHPKLLFYDRSSRSYKLDWFRTNPQDSHFPFEQKSNTKRVVNSQPPPCQTHPNNTLEG